MLEPEGLFRRDSFTEVEQGGVTLFRGAETHMRSVLKAVSWRSLGTLDTFAISWFLTGRVHIAGSIAAMEIVTKIVSLAAGSSTPQLLAPVGTDPSAGGSWPAGTYRIAFGYGVGSQEALTQQTVVYSATFAVR